jgi:hypothetical protein
VNELEFNLLYIGGETIQGSIKERICKTIRRRKVDEEKSESFHDEQLSSGSDVHPSQWAMP